MPDIYIKRVLKKLSGKEIERASISSREQQKNNAMQLTIEFTDGTFIVLIIKSKKELDSMLFTPGIVGPTSLTPHSIRAEEGEDLETLPLSHGILI